MNTWQIDSKEQVGLKTDEEVSWINIADEATTAHLKAIVQPVKRAAQISPQAGTQAINKSFEKWGLPLEIKIDNGYPFVNPRYMDIPSVSKMWWIGLGINVIQNTPGRPQENGAVECLQGICCRWVNPATIESCDELQRELDQISDFQRNHYRIPAKSYKTRIQLYPELEQKERPYDPDLFDIDLVYLFLATQVWERRVKQKGSTHFFGHEIYLSRKFKNQIVYITFDHVTRQWIFRNDKGHYLGASTIGVPKEDQIKKVAIMSKNLDINS